MSAFFGLLLLLKHKTTITTITINAASIAGGGIYYSYYYVVPDIWPEIILDHAGNTVVFTHIHTFIMTVVLIVAALYTQNKKERRILYK